MPPLQVFHMCILSCCEGYRHPNICLPTCTKYSRYTVDIMPPLCTNGYVPTSVCTHVRMYCRLPIICSHPYVHVHTYILSPRFLVLGRDLFRTTITLSLCTSLYQTWQKVSLIERVVCTYVSTYVHVCGVCGVLCTCVGNQSRMRDHLHPGSLGIT